MRMPGTIRTNITWGRRIWTRMADGRMHRITVRCGCRTSRMIGHHIVTVTGLTNPITAGRGLAMSHGAGRLITTGAGCGTAAHGHGGQDRCGVQDFIVRSGRRHTSRSLDSEEGGVLASVLDGEVGVALDGCPSGLAIASTRGGVDIAEGSEWQGLVGLALTTAMAGLPRCTRELNSRM